MQGRNNLGGGSLDINGIIEEAKAQGVVNAGDFVRFLTDYSESNKSSNTAINTTSGTDKAMSAVALDKNRVFIAYFHPVGVSGIVCTIQGSTIAVGTHTILYSGSNMGLTVSAVVLNASKVFVAYSYGSSCKLYAIICTIQGSIITVGTNTQLSSIQNSGKAISVAKLDEGKVFIAHSYESSYYLYAMACTINGTTITKRTDTKLCSDARNSGSEISVAVLDSSKVFIAFSHYVNSMLLYSIVCTINGTTITKGTANGINITIPPDLFVSAVALSSNKVFVAFSYNNSYSLGGVICIVNGTTITGGTVYALNSATNTGKVISAIALNENTVNILHSDSNNYLYSMLCGISGTNVTKKNDSLVSNATNAGTEISAVALSENNIFIGHSSGTNNCLHGMLVGYLENLVKTITSSTEQIDGIAITDGQAGQTVSVKVPNVT